MKQPGPKVAARQGGGFRQGFGHFNEEHLEQAASASAAQQKQLAQQTTQSNQPATGGSASPASQSSKTPANQASQPPPREVSSFKDELIKRPVKDIIQGLKSIFSLHDLLNINPGDTPEEQAHKEQLNQRYQKLDQEQQAVAQKLFEEKMKKQKEEEEAKQAEKQAKQQEKDQALIVPSAPKKGPVGLAGSKKQKATQQLQQQRQSIGRVMGAN